MSINFNVSNEEANKQRQKAFERQNAARKRAIDRQKAKSADPKHRAKQLEKAKQSRQRAIDKFNSPESVEKRRAKQLERVNAKRPVKSDTKPPAKKSSKGLMGRTPTALERALMNKIGVLPCVACKAMGNNTNTLVSLHHVDGRVKPHAHAKVLPLCAYHHDVPLTLADREIHGDIFPVHAKGNYGGKAAFEQAYGTQEQLLEVVYSDIGESLPWICVASSERVSYIE